MNDDKIMSGPGGMRQDTTGKPTSRIDESLKELGIRFHDKELLEKYYKQLSGVVITEAMLSSHAGMVLDFNALPTEPIPFKEIFIKWLIEINMPRIEDGQQPIITYEIILKCPLWRVIRPPLKRLEMTPEGLFNTSKPDGSIGRKSKLGSINKR